MLSGCCKIRKGKMNRPKAKRTKEKKCIDSFVQIDNRIKECDIN